MCRLRLSCHPPSYRELQILYEGEQTSGLEPLTCPLRVNCSYWTILCFTLLDNRRY